MRRCIAQFATAVLLLAAVLLPCTETSAFERNRQIACLSSELGKATAVADSLSILTDLYDLVCEESARDSVGAMIMRTSLHSGDGSVGLDILRDFASRHTHSDSLLLADMRSALKFPESEERTETVVYIRMMQNFNKMRHSSDEVKDRYLRELLREVYIGKEENLYENIIALHGICIYLGDYAHGDLLIKYLNSLGEFIEQLPDNAYMLKNCYYRQAAVAYAENEAPERSIEIDRKLLESIAGLEKGSLAVGRKYRDYNSGRYLIYTRLLSNYRKLEGAEVEDIFRKTMHYVETDSSIAAINASTMRPQIYYAMYKKDYRHALELMKAYIDAPRNIVARRRLLKMMIEAADNAGDKDVLLEASRKYNEALEHAIDSRARDKYRELQIIYDMSRMKAEHAREAVEIQHRLTITAVVVSAVMLVLSMIVFMLWRHSRRLAVKLSATNEALQAESYNLRQSQDDLIKVRDDAQRADRAKSDFIKNMSGEVSVPIHTINEYTNLIIDCSEAGMKPYLRHFADLIALNTELLTTIVNDVLNLSEIDSDSVSVSLKREPLKQLCKLAVESVRHRLQPGVAMTVDEQAGDLTVYTDPRRLMQILVQLLSNAAKFTREGEVKVTFEADEKQNMARIYVSDTGPGVTPENSERIFERFVKLDKTSQGVGIGLPIARHLAELLGGSVTLDTSYAGGARFVVTVPLG